jgi:hypothetical protein
LANSTDVARTVRGAVCVVAGTAILTALSACDTTIGLGPPSTRALEGGAADTLTTAKSFEITGSYISVEDIGVATGSGTRTNAPPPATHWSIDLQVVRPNTRHMVVTGAVKVEAIIFADSAYYRGAAFLSQHMGSDPLSRNLVTAAGNAWWKGAIALAPRLPDLTDGATFRTTFLGPVVTQRTDHVSADGLDTVEMSSPRADVFIAAAPPYQLVRVQIKKGVLIDGIGEGDLHFSNFNHDFGIVAPTDVIDFSNLSTLPPIYTVVSVDTSGCGSPCVVSAVLKNLGGLSGGKAPSTVTFTLTGTASGKVLGTCQAEVVPDVGYNATTTVQCTIAITGQPENASIVTALADNPGHA